MPVVQRGIIIVCDGKGDLASWLDSPRMQALGDSGLPARTVYLGPGGACHNVSSILSFTAGGPFPREGLEDVFRVHVNALRDAQRAFELAQQGVGVAPSTLIMVIGRAGDPILVEYFTDIVKFLHRLVDRYFPQQSFTWSSILMLPNLFCEPTYDDFGRTYALLKQIDGYQEDPPPFKTAAGEPIRLFDTIWLANSQNELGGSVGRFPEAGEALSTFLRAIFNGAVGCDAPPIPRLLEGKRPNLSSFGCTVVSLDRDYMNIWLANRLDRELLPRLLEKPKLALETILAQVKCGMTQSAVSSVQQLLAQDGGELFVPLRLKITPENGLSAESLLSELNQQRDAHAKGKAYDSQLELQKRRDSLEEKCIAQLCQSAGAFADEYSLRAGEAFLNVLANDPPEESDSPAATANFTLFNLLGGAIERLDQAIGYTAGAEEIVKQRQVVGETESQVIQARRERDVRHEEMRSLESRREEFGKLPEDEKAARLADLAQKVQELGAADKKVRDVEEQLARERATLRGLLIARRNYRREDRQGAYVRRTEELDRAIITAAENYKKQVSDYRAREVDRLRLYEERQTWVYRKLFFQPVLAVLGIAVLHVFIGWFTGFQPLISYYADNIGTALKIYGTVLLVYAGWTGWLYFQRFFIPIRDIEKELTNRLEQTMRAANATVDATNTRLRFDFDFELLHAVVKALYAVRERARSTLELVQSLIASMKDWSEALPPAAPMNSLYRSSMWTPMHLEQVFTCFIENGQTAVRIFEGEHGAPSKWMFSGIQEFREKLVAFGDDLYKTLESLSLEDFVFHPRYSQTGARDRLAAVFDAAAPYLKLKADLLAGNSVTNDVVFARNGRNSRFADEMRQRGITPRWQEQADGDTTTVVRTRLGFPAFMLAEIDTYWIDFLRNPAVAHPDPGEESFPELIPSVCRPLFNRVAEAFLLLWYGERVKYSNGEYTYGAEVLGKDRLPIYDRLMNDPHLDRCLDAMYAELQSIKADLLRNRDALVAFFRQKNLAAIEHEIISRYAVKSVGI
jgi:hypothetical protein